MRPRASTGAAVLGIGLALLGQADPAAAASFSTSLTTVNLTARTPSAVMELRNEGTEPVSLQLTASTWAQSPEGTMEVGPTDDLVFFPPLLTLAPGAMRKVRIRAAGAFGERERAYRLFVEELPAVRPHGGPVMVVMRTRLGIPVFLQPTATPAIAHTSVEGATLAGGALHFRVRNTGNVHLTPRDVEVAGVDPDGGRLFAVKVPQWYVLAGGERVHTVPLPDEACRRVAALSVDSQVALTLDRHTAAALCAGPQVAQGR